MPSSARVFGKINEKRYEIKEFFYNTYKTKLMIVRTLIIQDWQFYVNLEEEYLIYGQYGLN